MKIAVFCGSNSGNNSIYEEGAEILGRWIAESGHSLVYGGGDAGLMGKVAKTVHDLKGEVIGVLPGNVDFIVERPQPYVTVLETSEDMSGRKKRMFEIADAFIALPGGIGTLDEISEVITLTKIGVFHKPCIFFNTNDFYAPIREMFLKMGREGFLWDDEMLSDVLFSSDVKEIEEFIKNFSTSLLQRFV